MKTPKLITYLAMMILAAMTLWGSIGSVAVAGEWTEGTLSFVSGVSLGENGRSMPSSEIGLLMKGGKMFAVDPKLKIVDRSGRPLTIDQVTVPSKVRFLADESVIKELKVLEALPR